MLNFHHWVDAELMHLGFNLENQKSLTDQFLIIYKDYERNKELANEMEEYDKKLKSARNALVENYMTQRNHEFFKVNPTEEEFMKSVKKYLKN
jgi:glutamate synthase domain-containing protein 3